MDACDVIIIGGGPAGSTCAWQLKKAGLDVIVLDKAKFPRHKVCAGWVTPAVLTSLEVDVSDYAKNNIIQPITSFITGLIGGKEIRTEYDTVVSYGIKRSEFDHYLLKRAAVRTDENVSFENIERDGKHWVINGKYRAALIIGAGGHFCPIARYLGAKLGTKEAAVKAQEVEFLMTEDQKANCSVSAFTPELYFCPDLAGYGWIFRKGDYLNIGLGRQDIVNQPSAGLSKHVKQFVDDLVSKGKIPADITEKYLGHAYLLYGETPRKIVDDGILLIGDAAGLAYPESGEGIRPAIESGLLAAQVIITANRQFNRESLQQYVEALTERLGAREKQTQNSMLPSVLKPLTDYMLPKVTQFAAKQILSNRWASRNIVIDKWFLHANQKPLSVTTTYYNSSYN